MQVWRTGEFNTRLWRDMMNFWPAPFEADLTEPRAALVAHGGACRPHFPLRQ